ncbi:hypothetical protein ACH518_04695 [Methylomonas sp. HW2-6]|uniref:hypothetical protein n=1 Tax=Methylomonas sp. HW2-6 TaxID=3376687 RepID=UPI004041921F
MLTQPYSIPINSLNRGGEKEISRKEILSLYDSLIEARKLGYADVENTRLFKNITSVSKEDIERVDKRYGPKGLFNLVFLAQTNSIEEFYHVFRLVMDNLIFLDFFDSQMFSEFTKDSHPALSFDNSILKACYELNNFDHNVFSPEAARKVFSPGSKPGYVVYGLGGPRILVSHPFKGRGKLSYAVYENSVDVVTSLNLRGYYGTFLFLDNIAGLEYDIHGIPAWLAWFSYIASLSDLVLFVKEHDGDFGPSQKMEIDYTPDRINKKIIEVPSEELRWAKASEEDLQMISMGPNGIMQNEDFDQLVAHNTHARLFIEMYARNGFPKDRVIRILEGGEIEEYDVNETGYNS